MKALKNGTQSILTFMKRPLNLRLCYINDRTERNWVYGTLKVLKPPCGIFQKEVSAPLKSQIPNFFLFYHISGMWCWLSAETLYYKYLCYIIHCKIRHFLILSAIAQTLLGLRMLGHLPLPKIVVSNKGCDKRYPSVKHVYLPLQFDLCIWFIRCSPLYLYFCAQDYIPLAKFVKC